MPINFSLTLISVLILARRFYRWQRVGLHTTLSIIDTKTIILFLAIDMRNKIIIKNLHSYEIYIYSVKIFLLDLVEKLDKKIVQFILSLFFCNFEH